jgi:hypothetical protein
MGRMMRARCESKGKKFRTDYWDAHKLDYESNRRYRNYLVKYNRLATIVEVENQVADWERVDEVFYALYRKIHNRMVKQLCK